MSNDTATTHIALNSASPPNHACDEDDLKMLKLEDADLDQFAAYFELAFQGSSESVTVLVGLLQRLCGVEKLREQRQSGVWIQDVVGRLTHRIYTRSDPGLNAAASFRNEASDLTEQIFSQAFIGHERVIGFLAARPKS